MVPLRVFAALMVAGAVVGFATATNADVLITVDKSAQRMSVTVDGEPRWTWPVSTGHADYDTPNGRYTAFRMEKDHYSREWDDAPMPHSIFFTRIGHAIHGTNQTKKLGHPASHGCVRLAPENAAQLFALVRKHGMPKTRVVVDGSLPQPAPLVAEGKTSPDQPASAVAALAVSNNRAALRMTRGKMRQLAARAYALQRVSVADTPTIERLAARLDAPPPTITHQDIEPSLEVRPTLIAPPIKVRPSLKVPPLEAKADREDVEAASPQDPDDGSLTREKMRRLAARAYSVQPPPRIEPSPVVRQPPSAQRPSAQRPSTQRHARTPRQLVNRSPNVYYDPRVEVIEEVNVNGTWVRRRHYYRPARPQDFYRAR